MIKLSAISVLLLGLLLAGRGWAGLPEFDFCPLGGPTGWFNRMTDQHDNDWRRYYLPPVYPSYQPQNRPDSFIFPEPAYPPARWQQH